MFSYWETTFLSILNSVFLITGSCANLVIIISFFVYVAQKEATELLLVSLSIADFLVCTVYQTLFTVRINDPMQSQYFLSVMSFIGYWLMVASLNGLLAVTVDRFVSIYLPFKYVYWMTERNAVRIISASWMVSLVMAIMKTVKVDTVTVIFRVYVSSVYLLVPLLYSVIYREARRQARRINDQFTGNSCAPAIARRPTNKATKGVAMVLATTVACWLPMVVVPVILSSLSYSSDTVWYSRVPFWVTTIACLNSSLNPFIYYWQFKKWRRITNKLLQFVKAAVCA